MIPSESFVFEKQESKNHKNQQGNHLLQNLQFNELKRTAKGFASKPVCRNLKAILKKRNSPTDQDDTEESGFLKPPPFSKFQMTIPGHCHKRIRQNQKKDR